MLEGLEPLWSEWRKLFQFFKQFENKLFVINFKLIPCNNYNFYDDSFLKQHPSII